MTTTKTKAPKKKAEKAPKVDKPKTTKTAYSLVIDESSSMGGHVKAVTEFMQRFRDAVPRDAWLNITFFSNQARNMVTAGAGNVQIPDYRPNGYTALWDGVAEAARTLRHLEEPRLIIVITDGGENASKISKKTFQSMLRADTKTDLWTYVFLVPPGDKKQAISIGAEPGNVMEWSDPSAAFKAIEAGMVGFAETRAKGETSTKNYFTTSLAGVTKKEVREIPAIRGMTFATVTSPVEIRAFVEGGGLTFTKGCAFYCLTKAEDVQAYKEILIVEKGTKTVRGPGRDILGLPDHNVRVHPGDHGQFDIYVQSTSVNRKLVPGTKLLVRQ